MGTHGNEHFLLVSADGAVRGMQIGNPVRIHHITYNQIACRIDIADIENSSCKQPLCLLCSDVTD